MVEIKKQNSEPSMRFRRAATLVSMMPSITNNTGTDISISREVLLESRKKAVDRAQTLTHWANKAAVLGAERPNELSKEEAAVQYIRQHHPGVLLSYNDLSPEQKKLVG
jgi:hypothetical protein